jgi:hypothetical protein
MTYSPLAGITQSCSSSDSAGIAAIYLNKTINIVSCTIASDAMSAITIQTAGVYKKFEFVINKEARKAKFNVKTVSKNGNVSYPVTIDWSVRAMDKDVRKGIVDFVNEAKCGVVGIVQLLNGQLWSFGLESVSPYTANPLFAGDGEWNSGEMPGDDNTSSLQLVCTATEHPYPLTNLAVLTAVI